MHRMKAIVLETLLCSVLLQHVFGLRCFQCVGGSSSCRMRRKPCLFYETTCISLAYRSITGSDIADMVMKGCATTELCNQTTAVDVKTAASYMTSSCCESDYCNFNRFSAKTVISNHLQCYNSNSRTSSLICPEVNNQCVDVVTVSINETGGKEESYKKGCGAGDGCNSLLAYDTGNKQMYTQYQCCSGNNLCNTEKVNVVIPTNINGIQCWGCNETGKNECAPEKQKVVRCHGILIRCMEVLGPQQKTLMKGCCTEDLCSDIYPFLQPSNVTEIQCCAGNLCNKWANEESCPDDYNSALCPRWQAHLLLLSALLSCLFWHFL